MITLTTVTFAISPVTASSTGLEGDALISAKKEVLIAAPINQVWAVFIDIDNWSSWHPEISSAKLDGIPAQGASFRWKSSGINIHSTVNDFNPVNTISWVGDAFGANAYHQWHFQALSDNSTKVTSYEQMNGWLVWLLTGTMEKTLNESLSLWLQALKNRIEGTQAGTDRIEN